VRIANLSVAGFSASAASSPYAVWGALAVILTVIVVTDLALARLVPSARLARVPVDRDVACAGAAGLIVLALVVKFIAHMGSFGWGFYVDVALAVAVAVGAWLIVECEAAKSPPPR
jgi:uncharacterized membrane protein